MRWTLSFGIAAALFAGTGAALGDAATFWGTYRPQLFFGMRPQVPESLLTGLAWFPNADHRGAERLRHSAADLDGIDSYGWLYHDGRNFGEHEVIDRASNYRIRTAFVKTAADHPSGGNWVARVSGEVIDERRPAQLGVIYYVGAESYDVVLEPKDAHVEGHAPHIGAFSLRMESDAPGETYVGARVLQCSNTWRARDIIMTEMAHHAHMLQAAGKHPTPPEALRMSNSELSEATFVALQRNFVGNFSVDVFFDAHNAPGGARLNSAAIDQVLAEHRAAYEADFETRFGLAARGVSADERRAARELTAQIVGGIGYYYGTSIVDRRYASEHDGGMLHGAEPPSPELAPPAGLLTATPSRSVFPRGFYWDEGFHLAHISAWDPALAMEILRSWTALIDENGWVAREQILGDEARAQVPEAFRTQFPQYGNPPALIIGMQRLFEEARKEGTADARISPEMLRKFLHDSYEPWRRHYQWFRRTQRGEIREWGRRATSRVEAYRWRGRSPTHVLTSGLDDYPRAPEPHSGELHVDLLSWMGFFARAMQEYATLIGNEDDADEYARHARAIAANVRDLHWSEQHGLFCDASVDAHGESFHVCHAGYVSLFPLLLRLLPADSAQLGAVIKLLTDPRELWSEHGLRSLSKSHPLYGTEENYWRGAVWLPINYLALGALRHYAQAAGPHQAAAAAAYRELRMRIVRTVLSEYSRTGYTWEQYDPETGAGRRGHPFTGWTSLVVLIMTDAY